jgi:hypothetical protein
VQELVLLGFFVEKLQMFQEFCHILTDGLAFQSTPLWFEDEVQKHTTMKFYDSLLVFIVCPKKLESYLYLQTSRRSGLNFSWNQPCFTNLLHPFQGCEMVLMSNYVGGPRM